MTPELVARFRDRFFAALKTRVARLDELTMAVAADPSSNALHDLAMAFHSLSGIGGTYGYPGVTEIARAAEEKTWTLLQAGPTPGEQCLQSLCAAVVMLKQFATNYEMVSLEG